MALRHPGKFSFIATIRQLFWKEKCEFSNVKFLIVVILFRLEVSLDLNIRYNFVLHHKDHIFLKNSMSIKILSLLVFIHLLRHFLSPEDFRPWFTWLGVNFIKLDYGILSVCFNFIEIVKYLNCQTSNTSSKIQNMLSNLLSIGRSLYALVIT